jgi:hypothetical protein
MSYYKLIFSKKPLPFSTSLNTEIRTYYTLQFLEFLSQMAQILNVPCYGVIFMLKI